MSNHYSDYHNSTELTVLNFHGATGLNSSPREFTTLTSWPGYSDGNQYQPRLVNISLQKLTKRSNVQTFITDEEQCSNMFFILCIIILCSDLVLK